MPLLTSSSVFSTSILSNSQNGAFCGIANSFCRAGFATNRLTVCFWSRFSPVPANLVAQIVAGMHVELSNLLSVNLVQKEPELQLLLGGCLMFTSQPSKQRCHIEDIALWMEAFATFSLILVSYFPHHWKDLMQYQLLILCTYLHFFGYLTGHP